MAEFDDNELGALDDLDKFEDFEFDKEGAEAEDDEEGTKSVKDSRLDLILDIPLTVTVELGRSKMLIHDLLQLGQGSVIELTKMVGEPLEVLVNDKLVARGEVVVVNEKFGVRLTDIISPMERVQSLG
ncbi:flagellar motor switch protein FliN [Nitrospina watsonii]|uniref:Flagellar motor switch protein FliN n=1 Tax=Nitrospina watsonii TaxID=1323948 RepID=A0ABN8W3P6_9BACT|nr:flagellar motor switch protein FliN [Nitrospina watsonii]CAI2717976.1 flagellar motor switch protein FliN [Nitrospina watsonii]